MKKVAIVYYSRTGRTKEIAYLIKDLLRGLEIQADVYGLRCVKEYGGNYIRMVIDTLLRRTTDYEIQDGFKSTSYDLTIVGTPIWAGSISPPIRTFIMDNVSSMKNPIACFVTSRRRKNYSIKLRNFLTSLGYNVIADITVVDSKVDSESIVKFVKEIAKSLNPTTT